MNRPPVGFIVEGHGEYNCYRSLFCRIVNVSGGVRIPIVNAGGCGGVTQRLKENLSSLLLVEKPREVIVTIDLVDAVRQQVCSDCAALCDDLNSEAQEWLKEAAVDPRCTPLPERITAIIQVPKFESWMLADTKSLVEAGHLRPSTPAIEDADNISDPAKFLREHLPKDAKLKNPTFAKKLVSALNPTTMRTNSRSFDKFFRETKRAYDNWLRECRESAI